METKNVLLALAALAQESRLAIFRLLVQIGPGGMAASKIGEQLSITPSSLSFHMKELAHADLVSSRQDGRFVIYSANIDSMNGVIGFLSDNCCGGNPCSPQLIVKCDGSAASAAPADIAAPSQRLDTVRC